MIIKTIKEKLIILMLLGAFMLGSGFLAYDFYDSPGESMLMVNDCDKDDGEGDGSGDGSGSGSGGGSGSGSGSGGSGDPGGSADSMPSSLGVC